MKKNKNWKDYFFWNKFHSGVLMENLLFFLMIGLFGIIYIGNCHYAEKKARKIQVIEKEVQRLNRQHMALVAKVMNETKHAAVEKDVKAKGLKPPEDRPYRIVSY